MPSSAAPEHGGSAGSGRAPLAAVERLRRLLGDRDVHPCLGGTGDDQLGKLGDLLQVDDLQRRAAALRPRRRRAVASPPRRPSCAAERSRRSTGRTGRSGGRCRCWRDRGTASPASARDRTSAPAPGGRACRRTTPSSQRIQIWRCVAVSISSTVKSGLFSRASPPITENCTRASTDPPCIAVSIVPRSSKNWNSVPSSGVWPPHQSGLRTNEQPVAGVEAIELPRAGAVRRGVERLLGVEGDRCDRRLRVEARHEGREVSVRRLEVEHGDVRIARVDGTLGDHAVESGVGGGDEAVHGGGDIG